MPAMETEPGITSFQAIAISWLAAAAAFPLALLAAVLGQALGAVAGGCAWIGITVPVDRQIWALVNQPVLNFASLPRAGGYWLGSTLLPLVVAVTIIGFAPRARSFVVELTVAQIAWAMSVVAVAWMPLLDHVDGHVVRFLALHGRPTILVWLAPAAAAGAALLPTLRLLELARRRRYEARRSYRLFIVSVHLLVPAVTWAVLASAVRGSLPLAATVAAALPAAAALIFSWWRFPRPYVHRLEPPTRSEIAALSITAVLLAVVVGLSGRPLSSGGCAAVLWGQPQSFNNIRPWAEPKLLIGTHATGALAQPR
jgi:hypothetical protein